MGLTSIVKDAHNVLALTSEKAGDMVQTNQGTRKFVHWSMYMLLINGCASIATALAIAIMGIHSFAILITVEAICSFIGAYYIRRFAIAQAVSNLLQELTTRIRELFQSILSLKKANQGLDTKVVDLRHQREEEARVRQDQIKAIGTNTKELEEALKKVAEKEQELKRVQELLNEGTKQSDEAFLKAQKLIEQEFAYTKNLTNSCDNNTFLLREFERMWKQAESVKPIQEKFTQTVTQLPSLNYQWGKMLAHLTTVYQAKNKIISQLSSEIGRLSMHTKNLSNVSAASTKKAETLSTITTKLDDTARNDKKLNEDVNALLSNFSQQ